MDTFFAAWRLAAQYFARGISLVRPHIATYGRLTALYVSPALLVAALTVLIPEPNGWQQVLLYFLRSLTVVLGTLVVMVLVAYHAQGRAIGVVQASRIALHWVFRYLWTNAHTSLMFWIPFSALVWLHARQKDIIPLGDGVQPFADGFWWIAAGGVALAIHTRTMLAPFFAVHGDLPGTLATVESWRLSGRSFWVCMSTLVLASAPIALPLGLVGGGLLLALPHATRALLLVALPDLTWAAIQLIRPLLIPAVFLLYKDYWGLQSPGGGEETPLATAPTLARPMLAITRPLPHLGRWE
ncbi:MAG: hypothetical protein OXE05_00415 [Chloroflexi bacterium]|nr:hypothetical protein [Chloroflexota bacterium]